MHEWNSSFKTEKKKKTEEKKKKQPGTTVSFLHSRFFSNVFIESLQGKEGKTRDL